MKIIFDSAFDGRSWPIWPYTERGRVGEIRLGLLGILSYLEGMLGLRGPAVHEVIRISALIPFLKREDNKFWSSSFSADPFGVARNILHLHDFLVLHGWQGQALTPRLADLAGISTHIRPGIAQRLLALCAELADFKAEFPEVVLLEKIDVLPLLWQDLFRALQKQGAVVHCRPVQNAGDSECDLGNAQKENFAPCGDATLQLVRPDGMLRAAEEVAAWLTSLQEKEGLTDVVIIGGDAVLDNALHRFGLPVTGAEPEEGSSLLQLLPLVLDMGHNPPDPERVMDLLTLPISPVPKSIGRRLRDALSRWPAVGSDLWNAELEEGLQAIDDAEKRSRVADRLQLLFSQATSLNFTADEIVQRVDMLQTWLRGRFKDDSFALPTINQCSLFREMVLSLQEETVEGPLLQKLLDGATSEQHGVPVMQAQAGLAAVSHPEAVAGRAGTMVWWNFTRASVAAINLPLFSREEMDLLTEAGVHQPNSALLANSRAERWRRPLLCAESKLLLICPERDHLGEELYPHPLWDELLAASGKEAEQLTCKRIISDFAPALTTPPLLQVPCSQPVWHVAPETVTPREVESPSSLENFLGCPLKWSLQYCGGIRGNHKTSLPDLVPVLGRLAHSLLEEVLGSESLPTPEEGEQMAADLFAKKAPRMVAALFQEGMEVERERIRRTVILATKALLEHLHKAGVQKISLEQKLSGVFSSQRLEGFADLVIESPFTVVDMKRSWAKFYKKKMESGTALQIVLYGFLLKELRGRYPQLAYYTLEDQTLLTTDLRSFPLGEEAVVPETKEIFQIFEETFTANWEVVKSGTLLCPGNNGEDIESRVEEGKLILEPPCRFCEYEVLCGRRFQQCA
ncbi:MAG: PD-(D/E)XK nuclease family protein [Desulfobulbus sp.]